jgi:hypothetical protein
MHSILIAISLSLFLSLYLSRSRQYSTRSLSLPDLFQHTLPLSPFPSHPLVRSRYGLSRRSLSHAKVGVSKEAYYTVKRPTITCVWHKWILRVAGVLACYFYFIIFFVQVEVKCMHGMWPEYFSIHKSEFLPVCAAVIQRPRIQCSR